MFIVNYITIFDEKDRIRRDDLSILFTEGIIRARKSNNSHLGGCRGATKSLRVSC